METLFRLMLTRPAVDDAFGSKPADIIKNKTLDPAAKTLKDSIIAIMLLPEQHRKPIDHFMTYGEIWNGGPLPAISNPLYLPIADEIAERLERPGDEIPQGDPWMVTVPTSLVHLRADDKLPVWEKNDEGEWVEVTENGD